MCTYVRMYVQVPLAMLQREGTGQRSRLTHTGQRVTRPWIREAATTVSWMPRFHMSNGLCNIQPPLISNLDILSKPHVFVVSMVPLNSSSTTFGQHHSRSARSTEYHGQATSLAPHHS